MSVKFINEDTLKSLADELRVLTRSDDDMTIEDMISVLKESNNMIDEIAGRLVDITAIDYLEGNMKTLKYVGEGLGYLSIDNYPSLTTAILNSGTIQEWAFSNCANLKLVDFLNKVSLRYCPFNSCPSLDTIIMRSEEPLDTPMDEWIFSGSAVTHNTGNIYVPKKLIETYKNHSYWGKYKNVFNAIEDHPDVCGGV